MCTLTVSHMPKGRERDCASKRQGETLRQEYISLETLEASNEVRVGKMLSLTWSDCRAPE